MAVALRVRRTPPRSVRPLGRPPRVRRLLRSRGPNPDSNRSRHRDRRTRGRVPRHGETPRCAPALPRRSPATSPAQYPPARQRRLCREGTHPSLCRRPGQPGEAQPTRPSRTPSLRPAADRKVLHRRRFADRCSNLQNLHGRAPRHPRQKAPRCSSRTATSPRQGLDRRSNPTA